MKRIITIILFCLFFVACATTSIPEFKQVEHLIKIQISGTENSQVKISNDITKTMAIESTDLVLSNFTRISGNTAFVSLTYGLTTTDEKNLWFDKKYIEVHHPEITHFIIYLNSGGGNAFSGLSLAEFVKNLNKDFNTTIYAAGIVASAAVPILAVCENRIANAGTVFMVHEPSAWNWPGMESYSSTVAKTEMMRMIRQRYLLTLAENSKLTEEQWEEKEGKTTWFNAKKALEWGIIDRIE